MNPIPLRHNRITYAWACGRCHAVHVSGGYSGHDPALVAERRRAAAVSSKQSAAGCCACSGCGVELPGSTFGRCEACEAVEAARIQRVSAKMANEDNARHARNAAAIAATGGDKDAAVRLRMFMSELSEECWCASWLSECEIMLWQMTREPERGHTWGQGEVTPDDLSRLLFLADKARGWWRWDDALRGAAFVPMAEWLAMVAAETRPGGAVGSGA
jgi:hypothetical protein